MSGVRRKNKNTINPDARAHIPRDVHRSCEALFDTAVRVQPRGKTRPCDTPRRQAHMDVHKSMHKKACAHTQTHTWSVLYIRHLTNMKYKKKYISICLLPRMSDPWFFFSFYGFTKLAATASKDLTKCAPKTVCQSHIFFLKAAQGCSLCPCKNYSCLRETVDGLFQGGVCFTAIKHWPNYDHLSL